MPKSIRRVSFTRTVTFTTTVDLPGHPEETDANALVLAGGAAGNSGALSIGELLSGSVSNNGTVTRANWSVTGTSANVESYISRPQNLALSVGQRVASISPAAAVAAAIGKIFVVTTAGTTANSSSEPTWNLTDGGTTTDGTVVYRTIPKFPTLVTFAINTAYTLGQIIRPSATSMKEYLVTTAGTSAGTAPTWTSNDAVGSSITSGTAVLLAITDTKTYSTLTVYGIGDIVKPSAASSEEYIVTVAGTTDVNATLTASVGATVTRGTVTFKRIV